MNYPYTGSARIRFADTDANGHMYFANYLVLADEVMSDYWVELGWNFSRVEDQPALTFTVNSNIDFISECRAGETVDVAVGFSRLGTSSLGCEFEMRNRCSGDVAARGTFTSVFVDHLTRKSVPIPAAFREAILARQPTLAD